MKYLLVALAIAVPTLLFFSCKKEEMAQTCPVIYEIDTNSKYTLASKWQFVGFEDTQTGTMESPLCGQVESWINFTGEENTRTGNEAYKYAKRFEGVALINHYSGTYEQGESGKLTLSSTVKTTVTGTPDVQDFETRFHNTLSEMERYEILNNEMTLYPASGHTVMRFVAQPE